MDKSAVKKAEIHVFSRENSELQDCWDSTREADSKSLSLKLSRSQEKPSQLAF